MFGRQQPKASLIIYSILRHSKSLPYNTENQKNVNTVMFSDTGVERDDNFQFSTFNFQLKNRLTIRLKNVILKP